VVEKNTFVEAFHRTIGDWLERVGEAVVRLGEEIAGDDPKNPARHLRKLATLDGTPKDLRICANEVKLAAATFGSKTRSSNSASGEGGLVVLQWHCLLCIVSLPWFDAPA
jgi:hypothetical protein